MAGPIWAGLPHPYTSREIWGDFHHLLPRRHDNPLSIWILRKTFDSNWLCAKKQSFKQVYAQQCLTEMISCSVGISPLSSQLARMHSWNLSRSLVSPELSSCRRWQPSSRNPLLPPSFQEDLQSGFLQRVRGVWQRHGLASRGLVGVQEGGAHVQGDPGVQQVREREIYSKSLSKYVLKIIVHYSLLDSRSNMVITDLLPGAPWVFLLAVLCFFSSSLSFLMALHPVYISVWEQLEQIFVLRMLWYVN